MWADTISGQSVCNFNDQYSHPSSSTDTDDAFKLVLSAVMSTPDDNQSSSTNFTVIACSDIVFPYIFAL